jgi:phage I-like protein
MPTSWVHALPGGTYKHPVYGEMKFTEDRVQRLADSVTNKVRGVEPDIDYDHKTDKAMGNKAAGWVKTAETRPGREGKDLWLLVEWTPAGAAAIKAKEYRYFSSELQDEWEDAKGVKHKDVLLGGGVTNRPYMKQLLPLNLSELRFSDDEPPNEGEQVDPKALRRKLGLAETATDEQVDAKLAELTKPQDPPKTDSQDDELKKLAEGNPLVKAFMERMTSQGKQLADMQQQLVLSNVTRQLAELTTGAKVNLTALVLNEARDIMVGAPQVLSEKVFGLLKTITHGDGVIELGEKSSSGSNNPNRSEDTNAIKKFNDAVKKLQDEDKLDYATAVERAAYADRSLYAEYRRASYIPNE